MLPSLGRPVTASDVPLAGAWLRMSLLPSDDPTQSQYWLTLEPAFHANVKPDPVSVSPVLAGVVIAAAVDGALCAT